MSHKIISHHHQGAKTRTATEAETKLDTQKPPTRGQFKIGLGEGLGAISLIYVCSISAFNAGYFSAIQGHFIELFTFSDLLSTNIPIVQYFFNVALTYFSISIAISFVSTFFPPIKKLLTRMRIRIESFVLRHHSDGALFWAGVAALLGAASLAQDVIAAYNLHDFTIEMVPQFVFQGILIYFFWTGFKYKIIPANSLIYASLVGLFIFSHASGTAWIKSEMQSPEGVQALVVQDGSCLERKIIRSSNSGILLYNQSFGQFEFRNKDSIKTIFQGKGCP